MHSESCEPPKSLREDTEALGNSLLRMTAVSEPIVTGVRTVPVRKYLLFQGHELLDLDGAVERLRDAYGFCAPGESIEFEVTEMTDAEVEALPEL